MMFRVDVDRMHAVWSPGDRDLAMAYLAMEGFAIATFSGGLAARPFRHRDGWEIRIQYATKKRQTPMRSRKEEASCEG